MFALFILLYVCVCVCVCVRVCVHAEYHTDSKQQHWYRQYIAIHASLFVYSITDGVRSFFTVTFITHLSFFFSLVCAFIAFLAGVELALEHRVSDKL